MRKLYFLPAALLLGLAACNNNSDQAASTTDTTKKSADTMAMDHTHTTDNNAPIAPLPEVPAGAKIYFKNLKDGQTVTSPVKVEMGMDGLKVDTAGVIVAGAGHHHLLVDAGDSIAAGVIVPKDSTHIHFGKGQTSTEVKLSPGEHKLTLQFADGIHRSYGSKLATSIKVKVK